MPDRTINWGDSQLAAKYQSGDSDPAGGDFVVAQRADGSQVLLQWNDTAGQWESTGDVDLGGNDLNSVGAATVGTLEATNAITGNDLDISTDTGSVTDYLSFAGSVTPFLATVDVGLVAGDNNSNEIVNLSGSAGKPNSAIVVVIGEQDGGSRRFIDAVAVVNGALGEKIGADTGSIPRSYSENFNLQIAIDEPGGSYKISAHIIGGGI